MACASIDLSRVLRMPRWLRQPRHAGRAWYYPLTLASGSDPRHESRVVFLASRLRALAAAFARLLAPPLLQPLAATLAPPPELALPFGPRRLPALPARRHRDHGGRLGGLPVRARDRSGDVPAAHRAGPGLRVGVQRRVDAGRRLRAGDAPGRGARPLRRLDAHHPRARPGV